MTWIMKRVRRASLCTFSEVARLGQTIWEQQCPHLKISIWMGTTATKKKGFVVLNIFWRRRRCRVGSHIADGVVDERNCVLKFGGRWWAGNIWKISWVSWKLIWRENWMLIWWVSGPKHLVLEESLRGMK